MIIGVGAQAQMGKDTMSDYLAKRLGEMGHPMKRTAFASNVKRLYMETFGVSIAFVEEWKTKPEPPPGFDMTVRKSLQFIGDGYRQIKGSIWLDLCFRDKSHQIISDVRYVNEFMRVKQEGGFNILVGRTSKLNNDPNGSEAQIRPYVKWALDNLEDGARIMPFPVVSKPQSNGLLSRIKSLFFQPKGMPEHMSQFDIFIRNDGTVEELYEKVDRLVVPAILSYYKKAV